jgi:hypothetical protein
MKNFWNMFNNYLKYEVKYSLKLLAIDIFSKYTFKVFKKVESGFSRFKGSKIVRKPK